MDEKLKRIKDSIALMTGIDFPLAELEKLNVVLTGVHYKKGTYFVRQGESSSVIAFVADGLFRLFVTGHNGKEFTKNFCSDGQFMGAQTALFTGDPSRISIQALEDSFLYEVDYAFLTSLADAVPCWQKLLRVTTEKDYLEKEKRETELLIYDAKTRYFNFVKEHPKWNKRIKLHYIASYLGMSAETLSRIREQL